MTTTTTAGTAAAPIGTDSLARESGLAALAFSRGVVNRFIANFPEDKALHQPVEGANHLLWILGHLAWTEDFFLAKLIDSEPKLGAEWSATFGMGSTPVADPSAYPSLDEVKATMSEQRDALVAWFRSLDEEGLASPLPESMAFFAPNCCAVASSLACHESFHVGQLMVIRRSLGLPRVIG